MEPGSTHDLATARAHCLGALYPAAAAGLPTLADKGYQGVGIGVRTPLKGRNLGLDTQTYNRLLTGLQAIGERAAQTALEGPAPRHLLTVEDRDHRRRRPRAHHPRTRRPVRKPH